jgi:hypothetical protein
MFLLGVIGPGRSGKALLTGVLWSVQSGLWLQDRRLWLQLGSRPSLRVDLGYHLAQPGARRALR